MSAPFIREDQFIRENAEIFACPGCGGGLEAEETRVRCSACQAEFPIAEGIPQLFAPNDWNPGKKDVTESIRGFYEEHPFPDYDEFDNVASLQEKARRGVFAKLLDEQTPFGARVLEAGCGTGQLTNFLAIANRTVIGADLCFNSLRMGRDFRDANELKRAHFLQMNLFRPCFQAGMFDLVISNGVLHHTADPELAFSTLTDLVKPNGFIIIGLYHRYGRLLTDLRRGVFRWSRDRFQFLDRRLVDGRISQAKRTAWFMDQYKNPHESKHTIGQVLHWLKRKGLQPVTTIPKTRIADTFQETELLFRPGDFGNRLERTVLEMSWAFTRAQEGGFFIVIAKKSQSG